MIATFRSQYPSLSVGFPPDTFGYAEGMDVERDTMGVMIQDADGNGIPKKIPKKPAIFSEGKLALDDSIPEESAIIADMRKHPGLLRQSFYEAPPSSRDVEEVFAGEIVVHVPEHLAKQDAEDIEYLGNMFNKALPKTAFANTAAALQRLKGSFRIVGFKVPEEELQKYQLRGRLHDLMIALAAAGVWKIPEE